MRGTNRTGISLAERLGRAFSSRHRFFGVQHLSVRLLAD